MTYCGLPEQQPEDNNLHLNSTGIEPSKTHFYFQYCAYGPHSYVPFPTLLVYNYVQRHKPRSKVLHCTPDTMAWDGMHTNIILLCLHT